MEYYENAGGAVARLVYQHVADNPDDTPYHAEYWNTPDMTATSRSRSAGRVGMVGGEHEVVVEYFEFVGGAVAKFSETRISP